MAKTSDTKRAQEAWNNNNLAHTETWGFLFDDEELNVNFGGARDLKMSELAFYNPAVSSGMLDKDAEYRAARLDRDFRKKSNATFESDWTIPLAVRAMKAVLSDKDKLVCELAVKVDDIYNFSGETL
jgi:hypothetical protein